MKIQAHYKWWIAGELNFVVKIHVLIFCTKQDLMKVGKKASSGSFLRNPRSRFFSLLFTMLVGHDMHEFVKTWKTCAKWEYKIKTWYCKAPQMRLLLVPFSTHFIYQTGNVWWYVAYMFSRSFFQVQHPACSPATPSDPVLRGSSQDLDLSGL